MFDTASLWLYTITMLIFLALIAAVYYLSSGQDWQGK
jgi:hypothetical protein